MKYLEHTKGGALTVKKGARVIGSIKPLHNGRWRVFYIAQHSAEDDERYECDSLAEAQSWMEGRANGQG